MYAFIKREGRWWVYVHTPPLRDYLREPTGAESQLLAGLENVMDPPVMATCKCADLAYTALVPKELQHYGN